MTEVFQTAFGGEPSVWVRAPGRVDLMGSHTDYNDGFVLTMPIDRDVWIAAAPSDAASAAASAAPSAAGRARVRSMNLSDEAEFSLADFQCPAEQPWVKYVAGVA